MNEELKSSFGSSQFNLPIQLVEGLNQFAIISSNLDQEVGIKQGSLILDSRGPTPTITIN